MANRNKFNSGKTVQGKMASDLDDLAAFEQFKEDVLPMLQKAVKEGWSPQRIYEAAQAHAAAKAVTLALTEMDSSKALPAIKEVLDRSMGKAAEKKTIKHEFEEMTDEELNSLLASEMSDDDEAVDN